MFSLGHFHTFSVFMLQKDYLYKNGIDNTHEAVYVLRSQYEEHSQDLRLANQSHVLLLCIVVSDIEIKGD